MGKTAISVLVLKRILGRGMGKEEFRGVGNGTGLFALSSKTSLKTYMSLQFCWVYFGGLTVLRLAYRQPGCIQVTNEKYCPHGIVVRI